MTAPCAFDGCTNPASPKAAGGLCNSHYWQRHMGRPLTPIVIKRDVVLPWMREHLDHEGDDCLIWPFRHKSTGYGQVKYRGKMYPASRLMCMLAHGEPPTPKHQAAHSCGKGHEGCVNPRHLRWATDAENKADMLAHGTRVRGERQGSAKLTEDAVREIRAIAGEKSFIALAPRFGVSPSQVQRVASRKQWRHVA